MYVLNTCLLFSVVAYKCKYLMEIKCSMELENFIQMEVFSY